MKWSRITRKPPRLGLRAEGRPLSLWNRRGSPPRSARRADLVPRPQSAHLERACLGAPGRGQLCFYGPDVWERFEIDGRAQRRATGLAILRMAGRLAESPGRTRGPAEPSAAR